MADDPDWAPKQDMSLLCRVCANQHDYLIPIFEGEGLDHDMPTKMEKHLPIKVRENDKLPTQMCYQCASTIIAWSDLHTNCLEADKKLTRMLRINEKKSASAAGLDDDGGSDHYEDAYDAGGGGDEDEDFEKEIKQLISDAGVELGSSSGSGTTKQKLNKPPSAKPAAARVSRKRKSEATTPVKRESKKSKSEAAAGSSSSGTVALLKPKEENVSGDDSFSADTYLSLSLSHPRGNNNCDLCNLMFANKKNWQRHIQSFHPQLIETKTPRVRPCPYCSATFPFKNGKAMYHEHLRSVHNEFVSMAARSKPFNLCSCHFCGREFKYKETLRNHLAIHMEDTPYHCEVDGCTAKFKQARYLSRHVKAIHEKFNNPDPVEREEFCPNCGKNFTHKKALYGHLGNCNLYMQRDPDTKEARQKVLRTKPPVDEKGEYVCTQCNNGKKYSSRMSLYQHKKGHSLRYKQKMSDYFKKYQKKKQPKMCPLCGVLVKNLYPHMKLHSVRLHCDMCDKVFARKDALQTHMRVHTGERPFVCYVCGHGFKQSGDHKKHLKNVHKVEIDTLRGDTTSAVSDFESRDNKVDTISAVSDFESRGDRVDSISAVSDFESRGNRVDLISAVSDFESRGNRVDLISAVSNFESRSNRVDLISAVSNFESRIL